MAEQDRHGTAKLSRYISILASAVIAALGVAGYQNSGDPTQLAVFLAIAALALVVVRVLFIGVDKVLDSLEPKDRD